MSPGPSTTWPPCEHPTDPPRTALLPAQGMAAAQRQSTWAWTGPLGWTHLSDKEHGLRRTACLSQAQRLRENPATGLLQLWPEQFPSPCSDGQMCSAGPDRGRAAAPSRVFPGPGQPHTTLGLPRAPAFPGAEWDQQARRKEWRQRGWTRPGAGGISQQWQVGAGTDGPVAESGGQAVMTCPLDIP